MNTLYIPIETSSRELLSRTCVGLFSLQEGFDRVVIGRDVEVFKCIDETGVVLLKSAASFESKHVHELTQKGNVVFSLDEEGILPPINDVSINDRFSKTLLDSLSGVFINGPLELKSLPKYVSTSEKILITGNPRFDFYSPERRGFYTDNIKRIKEIVCNDKIILLVSRFGDANLSGEKDYLKLLKENGFMSCDESREFHEGFYNHSKKIFENFIELAKILPEMFPEYSIVVRPHPSECHQTWNNIADEFGFMVSSEFDIASWLASSKLMIHNGCTTSLEATAMGIPVISFTPVLSEKYDLKSANVFGISASSIDEVKSGIETIIMKFYSKDNELEKLQKLLKYRSDEISSLNISKALFEAAENTQKNSHAKSNLLCYLYFVIKEVIKLYLFKLKLRPCYYRKKFPYISKSKYKSEVDKIKNLFSLNKVSIKRRGLDVFILTNYKKSRNINS